MPNVFTKVSQKYPKLPKKFLIVPYSTQTYLNVTKLPQSTQYYPNIIKSTQKYPLKYPKISKRTQKYLKVTKKTQKYPEVHNNKEEEKIHKHTKNYPNISLKYPQGIQKSILKVSKTTKITKKIQRVSNDTQ